MKTIMVCVKQRNDKQPSCAARASATLALQLEQQIAAAKLPLRVQRFSCLGLCDAGPNIKIVGGDLFYGVSPAELPKIIACALED